MLRFLNMFRKVKMANKVYPFYLNRGQIRVLITCLEVALASNHRWIGTETKVINELINKLKEFK